MQNKFALKDLILMVLVGIVAVSVWLAMVQEDRRFQLVRDVKSLSQNQEQTLARVEQSITELIDELQYGALDEPRDGPGRREVAEAAYRIVQTAMVAEAPAEAAAEGQDGQDQPERPRLRRPTRERDESWAREGVEIEWQERYGFTNDPRQADGFQVGGEFCEIFEAQPAKIVPFLSQDVYGTRITDRVCDFLAEYDPVTLELKGELAEAWQYDPEGLWLRVKINPRARFSDGQKVTAEDVRWTFHEFIMNPEIESERARSVMDNIIECTVISDEAVEFTFREAAFNNKSQAMGFEVLPKHFYSRFTPTEINQSTGLLMGSGPFKLERLDAMSQWRPGRDIVLVRNENYWAQRPALERLRYKTVDDELARLTAYRNGEGDMILPSSPQFARVPLENPEWDKYNHSLKWVNMRSGYGFIGWQCGPRNGKLTPFHDPRVRMAMTHLLDREAMIRDIWSGLAVVAKGPFNPTTPASNPDIEPWPYDLEKAKALLAEAGWRDRDGNGVLENEAGDEFVFEFTRSSGGEVAERVSNYVKQQCARVGIRCNVRVQDWSVYVQTLATRDFDAIIMGWSANSPESDLRQMFHSDSINNQGDNFVQWSNAEADRLLEEGRRELDDAKRMKIWHELERVLHEEQPYTFIRNPYWLRFVKGEIGNIHTYPKGLEPQEFFRASSSTLIRGDQ